MFWSDEPGKSWMMISEWIAGQKGLRVTEPDGEQFDSGDNTPEVY
jgi:hypothetical protein